MEARKLQGEIDRVLKKVQGGFDVFDSIWTKVRDTGTADANRKKLFSNMKKEIEKLQRYRDQIKTWLESRKVKDPKDLKDACKRIEKDMKRFKDCEEAFSKEQQPEMDPKEKAKAETRDWMNKIVSELEFQIDSFEAEMVELSVERGKAIIWRLKHLETSISRHKAHISKLELVLELLDDDKLSSDQVNDFKCFIDDYVKENQLSPECYSDVDFVYITLPLANFSSTIPPVRSLGAGRQNLTAKDIEDMLVAVVETKGMLEGHPPIAGNNYNCHSRLSPNQIKDMTAAIDETIQVLGSRSKFVTPFATDSHT